MCDCRSHNKPEFGGSTEEIILRYDIDRLVPEDARKTVCVDACIVPQIKLLWSYGIETGGCCCGHNREAPSVGLICPDSVSLAVSILSSNDARAWKIFVWSKGLHSKAEGQNDD